MLRKGLGRVQGWVLGHLGHWMTSSSFLSRLLLELKESKCGPFKVSLGPAEEAPGSSASSLLCEQPLVGTRALSTQSFITRACVLGVHWDKMHTKELLSVLFEWTGQSRY